MKADIKLIEKEAHHLLEEHKYQEAAELYQRVAQSYKKFGKHQEAAMCLASAASSRAMNSGERTFYLAANDYEKAAKEAERSGDLEYTALLYKHAAVCYERDKDYMGFSKCYYLSKETYRRFLAISLFHPRNLKLSQMKNLRFTFKRLFHWLALTFSSCLWGHGEHPHRTVLFGGFNMLLAAFIFTQGYLLRDGLAVHPTLPESIYFSVITFSTIGYGDLVPIGFNRWVAILESFGGLFIIPIFITGLCRKYLRF